MKCQVSHRPYASDEVSLPKKLKKRAAVFHPTNHSVRVFNNLERLEEELVMQNKEGEALFPGIVVDDDHDIPENDELNNVNNPELAEVIESIGYAPVKLICTDHTADGDHFILKRLPMGTGMKPQPFKAGFRQELKTVHAAVKRKLEDIGGVR